MWSIRVISVGWEPKQGCQDQVFDQGYGPETPGVEKEPGPPPRRGRGHSDTIRCAYVESSGSAAWGEDVEGKKGVCNSVSVKACKAVVKPFIRSSFPLSCLLVSYCEQQSLSDLGAIRAASNLERSGLQAAVLWKIQLSQIHLDVCLKYHCII